jgi:hypothetical protein
MKEILFFLVLMGGIAIGAYAQTLSEWFNQKKTELKYMKLQIAELKAYTSVLEKGYSIAKDGNQTIREIKHGDFTLHEDHFLSLSSVSWPVANDPRVQATYDLQVPIMVSAAKLNSIPGRWGMLAVQVGGLLESECNKNVEAMKGLTQDANLEMSDDERLEGIEIVYRHQQQIEMLTLSSVRNFEALKIQDP